jgi:HAD superfamily hydrolase (TIGR01509 family)
MTEAVIFDWDGTLADTKKAVVQSFQKVLTKAGCNVSDEFIERRMGIGTKKTIIEAFRECKMRLNVSTLQKLVEEKIEIQSELTTSVFLFDGVRELLEALHNKTRVALATMSGRKVIDKVLSEKGLNICFEVVVSADDVTNPKPNPEIFLVTAQKLKVLPKKCVVIEDSVFGVRAANAAEMRCIVVPSGAYSVEELQAEHPDLILKSLLEKEKIFEFIFGSQQTED